MFGGDGLAEDFGVEFDHVRAIAAYGADIAAFFAAFAAGEDFRGEQGRCAGCAEEEGVCLADAVFGVLVVFSVVGGEDAELEFGVRIPEWGPFWRLVEVVHD